MRYLGRVANLVSLLFVISSRNFVVLLSLRSSMSCSVFLSVVYLKFLTLLSFSFSLFSASSLPLLSHFSPSSLLLPLSTRISLLPASRSLRSVCLSFIDAVPSITKNSTGYKLQGRKEGRKGRKEGRKEGGREGNNRN